MLVANRLMGTLLCLVWLCTIGFAQDWPQWRGPNRDGKVAGFTAPQTWPAAFTQQWKVKVGAGDASPVLVGDRLYIASANGEQESYCCLNAADGKLIWQNTYLTTPVTGPAARHAGPRGTPAVADGKVVMLGCTGIVYCFETETGTLLWQKNEFPNLFPMFFTAMSPLIVDGLAILQLGGKDQGGIIAFELATGEVKWRWLGETPDYASPVLMTIDGVKQIVTLTSKSLVGVGVADGKLLWSLPFPAQGRSYNAATPIIDGNTVIYSAAGRGTHAVQIAKKDDAFTATVLWDNPGTSVVYNTPVLKNGLLFGLSDRGFLFCLNAKTGATAWTDANPTDRGGFGTLLDAGDVMLALAGKGELIAFKPDDTAYTELARIKVADTATYAAPLIAGNRIFVKDQDSVMLWEVK